MWATIKKYLLVAKPGVVCGNLVAATGGLLLASGGKMNPAVFWPAITGIFLVVASACVFNNYLDQDLDRKMARTSNRILAQGLMSPVAALFYGSLLGIAGLLLLWAETNRLCLVIVLCGFGIYVGLYSLFLKRQSVCAVLIGSLAGAAPPLAGYCAVSNQFDGGAIILLSIFCLWQIPHSHAIAILSFDDYRNARIPVLPVRKGLPAAKKHIFIYISAFTVASLMPTFFGYTGYNYLAAASASGFTWLILAWISYRSPDNKLWAKRLFVFSIMGIFVLSAMMGFDARIQEAPVLKTKKAVEYTTSFILNCFDKDPPR